MFTGESLMSGIAIDLEIASNVSDIATDVSEIDTDVCRIVTNVISGAVYL